MVTPKQDFFIENQLLINAISPRKLYI